MNKSAEQPEEDELEALVAECLERSAREGADALEHVAAEHPQHADELRRRILRLERLGLVRIEPERETLASGEDFGERYRLLGRLGRGGMGVVHLAFDRVLGRQVALKTIEPGFDADERAAERFRREIESHGRLSHPNVVAILDVGEERGLPYFTMEYVGGETLAHKLTRLRTAATTSESRTGADLRPGAAGGYVETACRIAQELAGALAYLHSHGVVHRDVKPANVIVADDGRVLLFDLGLAHLADAEALTRTGDLAGTPAYMAPEQVTGAPDGIDGRVDVYALCAVLYELLALRPPFAAEPGAPPARVLREIVNSDPPLLRALEANLPRDLETVIHTGLEKQPGQRYPDANALGADLGRFLAFRPVRARPTGRLRRIVRWARRNRAAAWAAGLAAAGIVGTPLFLWRYAVDVSAERDRANIAAAEARREAADNRETAEFLSGLVLRLGERAGAGTSNEALVVLQEATLELDARAVVSDATRARLLEAVARVRLGLGGAAEAVPLLDRALALRQRAYGEHHLETAATLQRLAAAHAELGNGAAATRLLDRAELALGVTVLGGGDSSAEAGTALACRTTRGDLARAAGDLHGARELWWQALETLEQTGVELAVEPAARAELLERLGEVTAALGDPEGGAAYLTRAVDERRRLWEPRRGPLVECLRELARVHAELGRMDRAAEALDGALGLLREDRAGALHVQVLDERLALEVAAPADLLLARLETAVPAPDLGILEELRRRAAASSHGRDDLGRGLVAAARGARVRGELERAAALLREALVLSPDGDRGSEPRSWVLDARWELTLTGVLPAEEDLQQLELLWARLSEGDPRRPRVARAQAELWLSEGRPVEAAERFAAAERLVRRRSEYVPPGAGPRQLGAFGARFQAGITALQAGHWRAAEAAFQEALEASPRHPLCAYNAACALAGAGDVDGALRWLERAVAYGLPSRGDAPRLLGADPDLSAVRGHARFDALLRAAQADARRANEFAASPTVVLPPDAAGSESGSHEPRPLLVVLHARGATKLDVASGLWAAVAANLGYVLLAPSATLTFGPDPTAGMRWTFDPHDASERRWLYERPVRDALAEVAAVHAIDPRRVFLAGVGDSGLLAFDLALEAPELFAGVLLADAVVREEVWAGRAERLAGTGLRVALIPDLARPLAGLAQGEEPREAVRASFARLLAWGLDPATDTCEGATAAELTQLYSDALRAIARTP